MEEINKDIFHKDGRVRISGEYPIIKTDKYCKIALENLHIFRPNTDYMVIPMNGMVILSEFKYGHSPSCDALDNIEKLKELISAVINIFKLKEDYLWDWTNE